MCKAGGGNLYDPQYFYHQLQAVSNRWTGLLEWTTGMDFDLFFFPFFSQELTIYIEELV